MIKKLWPPTIIFICYLITYLGISEYQDNDHLFSPIWDVEHYLSISLDGYEAFPCTPGVNGRAGEICGNTGWYPVWPLVIKVVRPLFGGNSKHAFNYMPVLLLLASMVLLYLFVLKFHDRMAAIITILAIAFNPSSFYFITGFPYALFAFLFAVYIWLLYSPRTTANDISLFITALALALTYPTGIIFGLIPLIRFIDRADRPTLKSIRDWLKVSRYLIPFLLGPLLLFLYFYIEFDNFWLQLDFQAKYHRSLAFPLWIMIKSLFSESIISPSNIAILWFMLVLVIFWPGRKYKELSIPALALFLFSLSTGSTMSIYRHYLIIFPAYMMIGISHRPIWLKLVVILIGFAAGLLVLFPRFLEYRLM